MVRDYFDTGDVGIVLIGMPGLPTTPRLLPAAIQPSRIAHQYRPLDSTDIPQVLSQYWQHSAAPTTPTAPSMPNR